MDAILESLQSIFGEGVDLAALASGAGLFGGGASTALAVMISGAIKRFLFRTFMTAVLTGVGFLFLLDFLGFEIVPPEDFANTFPFSESFSGEEASGGNGNDNERRYVIRSPFRD